LLIGSISKFICGQVTASPVAVVAAPSAWNKAGTWEERNFTSFVHGRVKSLLTSSLGNFQSGGFSAQLVDWKVEGDSQLILVRGKQRLGFELNLTCEFKGSVDAVEVAGKVWVPSVDLTEAEEKDFSVEVTFSAPSSSTPQYTVCAGAPRTEFIRVVRDSMAQVAVDLRAEAEKQN